MLKTCYCGKFQICQQKNKFSVLMFKFSSSLLVYIINSYSKTCKIIKFLSHALQFGLNVGPRFRTYVYQFWIFFPGSTALLKALHLSNFEKKFHGSQIFSSYMLIFLLNFPGPMFIQGPLFIIFAKFSRPYVYFLPYIQSGLQSIT